MNMYRKFARLAAAAAVGFCLQPVVMSAAAQQSVAIDSVNKHVRAHPKPKKASIASASAKSSSGATSAKPKRLTPSIIMPAAQQPPAPVMARKATAASADSVPAVRRAAVVPKSTAKRKSAG